MLEINDVVSGFNIIFMSYFSTEMWLGIEDRTRKVVITGKPVKFEYFMNDVGDYMFRAVFSKYTVSTSESEEGG